MFALESCDFQGYEQGAMGFRVEVSMEESVRNQEKDEKRYWKEKKKAIVP
jgi:hypothetical protein